MAESSQSKLDRVRSPRVQIKYEVYTGSAIELKELPFVMGVLGDFTGDPVAPLAAMKKREFVEIGPENFDKVLKGMNPHLAYSVENKLSDAQGQVKVDLKFEKLEDFSPANVAKQVGPLKELLDLRSRLSDLRGSLQGNDKLDQMLVAAVSRTEERGKLESELGKTSAGGEQ